MALIPPPPPQPQQQASGHHHSLEYLPRPLGDETIDAHLKFNPYRLTIMEMCYLGLIVAGLTRSTSPNSQSANSRSDSIR